MAWGILPTASPAPNMADVFMARQCENGLVKVIIGDISKIEADVMVTTANNRLAGREGVDALVHKAAGPELREACNQIAIERRKTNSQPCPVGTSVVTEAYDLSAKKLIHVVGPDCRRPTQDESRRSLLKKAYETLFAELENVGDNEIVATPPLSMDVFSYPHREGARMTMEIVLGWMDTHKPIGVKEFWIVTQEMQWVNNLRTVYRESEDQFAGKDVTRQFRSS
ncbi:MAG: macro domain-containing protein [Euryarchaeota archaeon]|nr:macro domain-containing protein [Euryarchaeota archaeon]